MLRPRRVAAALAVALLLLLGLGGIAQAQLPDIPTGTDCLNPPQAASPKDGMTAWLDPGPTTAVTGDPFAPQTSATLYDVYGYAGFKGIVFDPGCANTSRFWDGPNDLANLSTAISAVAIATTVRLARVVMDGTFGSIFEPLTRFATDTLGARVFIPLISVGLLATGLYFLARARLGDVAGTAQASVRALAIVCAGLACATWALTIGVAFDKGISGAFSLTNQVMMVKGSKTGDRPVADAIAINLVDQTLYNAWKHKTFGNNPQAAAEFGPGLFKAGALTRDEQGAIDANPASAKEVLAKKKEQYKQVAKQLQTKYPQAYAVLAGNDTWPRVDFALASLIGTLAAVFLLLYALLKIAYAIAVARIGVAVTPGLAVIAQFPRLQHHAVTLLGWIAHSCVTALIAGALFVVVLVGGVGGIMAPENTWHPLLKILAMIIASIVLWKFVKHIGLGDDIERAKRAAASVKARLGRKADGAAMAREATAPTRTAHNLFAGAGPVGGYAEPVAPPTRQVATLPVPTAPVHSPAPASTKAPTTVPAGSSGTTSPVPAAAPATRPALRPAWAGIPTGSLTASGAVALASLASSPAEAKATTPGGHTRRAESLHDLPAPALKDLVCDGPPPPTSSPRNLPLRDVAAHIFQPPVVVKDGHGSPA